MELIFDLGDRAEPVGHALIYFRADDDSILATYVTVPPIAFNLSKYMPGFLAGAMQGMDLGGIGDMMMATPMPPIPEPVNDIDYLLALGMHRKDDVVYGGGVVRGDPMRLAAETAEAARAYGEMYTRSSHPEEREPKTEPAIVVPDVSGYADLTERERLNELTMLTGRLRDQAVSGADDSGLDRQLTALASFLPSKYRADRLIIAARRPGEQGQRLAELYLERSYKLFNEDYLDLERLDREIEALER